MTSSEVLRQEHEYRVSRIVSCVCTPASTSTCLRWASSHKDERNCAHTFRARGGPYAPLSRSHAVPVAPGIASSMKTMWSVTGRTVTTIDNLAKQRKFSPRLTAVAIWWCKWWLWLISQSELQMKGPLVDIETISLRMRMAAVNIRNDRHVTNNRRTKPPQLMSTYEVRLGS